MTIKSDKWIRRMAENEGMIDPYEPGQVRDHEDGLVAEYTQKREDLAVLRLQELQAAA